MPLNETVGRKRDASEHTNCCDRNATRFSALTYATTTLIAATTESTTLAVTMIVIANAGLAFYVVPYWLICTDVARDEFLRHRRRDRVALFERRHRGGAFVAPLVLAVAIMLVAATTMIALFHIRPLSSLLAARPGGAKLAA
jgi:hypothetical protein